MSKIRPIQQASALWPGLESARVLVTGGAGFLGARVIAALQHRGAHVCVLDNLSSGLRERLPSESTRFHFIQGDARHVHAWQMAFDWGSQTAGDLPLRIVHLAGTVGVRRVLANPPACRANHLEMGHALLRACERFDLDEMPVVLCASSSEVYLESADPLREDSPTLQPEGHRWGRGRWCYATSKLEVEQLLKGSSVPTLDLRLFNVVGPGQSADSGMVLPRFVEAARAGEPLTVYGNGSQVRTLGHVGQVGRDIAELAMRIDIPLGAMNLGGTARTTIADLAEEVLLALGESGGKIAHIDPSQDLGREFEEVRHREPDLSRARSVGLVRDPWTLQDIIQDVLRDHPVASVTRILPDSSLRAYPSPADENCPHPDPLELGRTRAAGPGQ